MLPGARRLQKVTILLQPWCRIYSTDYSDTDNSSRYVYCLCALTVLRDAAVAAVAMNEPSVAHGALDKQ